MYKCFQWATALSIFVNFLIIESAFSEQLSTSSSYPVIQNFKTTPPLCYMETADGKIIELQNLCTKNSAAKAMTNSNFSGSPFRRDCSVIQCRTSSQIRFNSDL